MGVSKPQKTMKRFNRTAQDFSPVYSTSRARAQFIGGRASSRAESRVSQPQTYLALGAVTDGSRGRGPSLGYLISWSFGWIGDRP
jgi:hypothetical protein